MKFMDLGSYLKSLRLSRRLTLQQLAQQAAIAPRTLSYWEANTFRPRIPEMDVVLAALNTTEQERLQALLLMGVPRAEKRLGRESEQKGIGPSPSGGDLLRALRQRRQFSLEHLSPQVHRIAQHC